MNLREMIYDLKNQRKTLLDALKAMAKEGKSDTEEYTGKMADVDKLSGQIKALEDLLEMEAKGYGDPGEDPTAKAMKGVAAQGAAADPAAQGAGAAVKTVKFCIGPQVIELPETSIKSFADAARAGFVVAKAAGDMAQEGVDAAARYTAPEASSTPVDRRRDATASLRDLVGVETVSTSKGRRTFKKRSQQSGFAKVAEGGKIGKKATPQFSVLEYAISKYAGYMPVTNELLEDSDANIVQMLLEWISDEARVTDNTLIREAINKKAAVDLKDLDGLKKAVLVDLDAAFRSTTKIVTNANGVYYLSTLKDANKRDLLTPIPSEPGKMQLACGAVVVPVVEFPNADLPNSGTKVPFIVGDLQEGIRLFDRKMLTVTSSDVAVAGDFNAFEQDMTLTRAIERLDVRQRDAEAYINGYIDTAAAAAASAE